MKRVVFSIAMVLCLLLAPIGVAKANTGVDGFIEKVSSEHVILPLSDPDVVHWRSRFSTYFSRGSWITRDGKVSLSLVPKNPALWSGGQLSEAWKSVYAKFGSDPQWKNTSSMKGQFECHRYKAFWKSPWNLEPWRSSYGFNCN